LRYALTNKQNNENASINMAGTSAPCLRHKSNHAGILHAPESPAGAET